MYGAPSMPFFLKWETTTFIHYNVQFGLMLANGHDWTSLTQPNPVYTITAVEITW